MDTDPFSITEKRFHPAMLLIEKAVLVINKSKLLAFIVLSISCLFMFGYHMQLLISSLLTLDSVITIETGTFYLLGISVAASALLVDRIYALCHQRTSSNKASGKVSNVVTRVVLYGWLLMALTPFAIHSSTRYYLESNHYVQCQQALSKWLFMDNTVYVSTPTLCNSTL